jgi:preprotein translocase subunit Sss1
MAHEWMLIGLVYLSLGMVLVGMVGWAIQLTTEAERRRRRRFNR